MTENQRPIAVHTHDASATTPARFGADTISPMRIFNTLGRTLQDFVPRDAGRVGMYVCGATVQAEPHVGHGRYAVVFDVVRRYFEWLGYD
ncbi:MAG: cysteine--tRNA ligase, partial [Acidimicrobiia bacterium]|nr:cysteine--tRNA ligase [Acidimicrobiia bacterium]